MKFVSIRTDAASSEEILAMLADPEKTNKNVAFDERAGKPTFHLRRKGESIRIKCEYVGGATRDNAFLDGTVFRGKVKEQNGVSSVSGIITTAPIFHLFMLALFAVFIVMCIVNGGFNIVPVCLVVFDIFMFYREFKKQGMIKRYILRAVRRAEREKQRQTAKSSE